MSIVVGLLLPRSTDYPALGFDILDGLRLSMKRGGEGDVRIITENTGFGEDQALTYAKAEKLLLQDNVDVVVAYSTTANAEPLYNLAAIAGKPFIFLDPGMQVPELNPQPFCFHISLQGIHACRLAGFFAGENERKVLMATSFYDGGYRGPWGYTRGLEAAGGTVCGNYVSGYKEAEFNIDGYINLLQHSGAQSVAACFSSYLANLFIKALKERDAAAKALPFYCSPFMAEEMLLQQCDFPGGEFYAIVPWLTSLQHAAQDEFTAMLRCEKNKQANIFHLLGWEAGIVFMKAAQHGVSSLQGFSYDSPRGPVTIHPATHYTYAPLYKAEIRPDDNGKCALHLLETILVSPGEHEAVQQDKPGPGSSWRNNYLCI